MNYYPNHKMSNTQWSVKLPAHWDEYKISWMFKFITDKNHANEELLSVFLNLGVVSYSSTSQKQVHKPSEDLSNYQLVMPGDFVLNNQQAWRGSVGISKYRGIISPAYYVLRSTIEINPNFLNYVVRDRHIVNQFVIASKGVGSIQRQIYVPYLKNVLIQIPPIEEQDQIVRYLDWKTAEMNRFIRAKKKQIKKLEELKISLLNEAVTKGIDKADLKDSGHHWIGKIPVHWSMEYSKHFFYLRKDKAYADDEQLTSSQQYGIISQKRFMELENRRVTVVLTGEDILKHVSKGDFVISMRSFQGGIEYSTLNGKISSAYVMLIPNHKYVYDGYYKWLFKSPAYIKALQGTSDLVRDGQALRYSNFAKVYLPNIPLDEQERIARFLNEKIPIFDSTIEEIKREITLIEELKTKLISDVVTGQIDVRGIVIPDYIKDEDILDEEMVEESGDDLSEADADCGE